MRLAGATIFVLLTASVGHVVVAQLVPATARFDVASIKPVADPSAPFRLSEAGARLFHITARGGLVGRANLRTVISVAYGAQSYERTVTAEPSASRLLEESFEIIALPPESSSPPNRDEVRAMSRQMLAERFGLKVRIDTELVSATVLRVIRQGAFGRGMQPAPEGCTPLPGDARRGNPKFAEAYLRSCGLNFFDDRIRGTVTLDEFASSMSSIAGRPILNRTDLEGMFAIDVAVARTSWALGAPSPLGARVFGPAGQSDAPAFVDALRDQMGLSARTERASIRLFVVEHVGPLVEN